MNQPTVSPVARRVMQKCGGAKVVSKITGRSTVTIYKWNLPRDRGGSGGLIPPDCQVLLMAAAIRGEVPLAPADFFDLPETAPNAAR